MLRTNLQYTSPDRPLKTLLVTSAAPEEGKSTVSANLAVALSQTGKRVIAVNVDLRRPTLHRFFWLPSSPGLTSVLVGNTRLEEALHSTQFPTLSVLPSGPLPPNAAELLGSERMTFILNELRDMADIIVLDAPPLQAVTDPSLLAPQVDGTLLIIQAGVTPREQVVAAKQQLLSVGGNIAGLVVTGIEQDSGYYYYYGYSQQPRSKRDTWWRRLFQRAPDGAGIRADAGAGGVGRSGIDVGSGAKPVTPSDVKT